MGFGDASSQGRPCMLDARQRRCTGATGIATDQDVIGMSFRTPVATTPTPHFADQLDADSCTGVGVLQVVGSTERDPRSNRCRDVVWADQTNTRSAVTNPGDVLVDLLAGQFAPFAWLGALRNLDLKFIRIGEVFDRYSESTGSHLLDRRSFAVAIWKRLEADRIFTTFARVALASQAVHGHSQCFVSFGADRSEAHGTGTESLHNLFGRLYFFDRHRRASNSFTQSQ